MSAEAEFLPMVENRLNHVSSLVHGLWMACAGVDDDASRGALQDWAHLIGDEVDRIAGIINKRRDDLI